MKKLLGALLILFYSCTTTNDGNTTTTNVVPLPPTNLVGTVSPSTTINLSWIDNSTNETGFKIERKVSGGDYAVIGTTDADKTTFSDSGLSLGLTYTYRVYAYNSVGSSLTYAYSLDIKTANVPILTTTLATLTFGGGASSGGNITDNSGSDVTARGVVWSTNTTPTIDLSTKTVDGTGNGVFTSAITGLTAGTTYYVRAYATNSAGTAYGNQITFTETSVPYNGLVGYWPFNGNANDESGNVNNGTVNGATLTTDRFGNANSAYSFDGVSNFIEVNSSNSINITSSYTLSAWINVAQWSFLAPIDEHAVISKVENGNWYGGYEILTSGNNGTIAHSGNIGNSNIYISNNGYSISNWYNVIVTYDGTSIKMYINGLLVNSKNHTGNIQTSAYPLRFGRRGGAGYYNNWFKGKIDDIGIWNRALSQAEISAMYNSTGK